MAKSHKKRRTTADKLGKAIADTLSEYDGDIKRNLDLITAQMGKAGAAALRQSSREKLKKRTGEYAKGWKYQSRSTQRYSRTTIFNEHYSLPHLLEHGHVTRNGDGRVYPDTPPHEHIAPVERQLTEAYQREVIDKL